VTHLPQDRRVIDLGHPYRRSVEYREHARSLYPFAFVVDLFRAASKQIAARNRELGEPLLTFYYRIVAYIGMNACCRRVDSGKGVVCVSRFDGWVSLSGSALSFGEWSCDAA
jgi:hypothetical protein